MRSGESRWKGDGYHGPNAGSSWAKPVYDDEYYYGGKGGKSGWYGGDYYYGGKGGKSGWYGGDYYYDGKGGKSWGYDDDLYHGNWIYMVCTSLP